MQDNEFKKKQSDEMRKVSKKGRKQFLAKFKTPAQLSAYMRKLSEKGKAARMKGLQNYWINKRKNEKK